MEQESTNPKGYNQHKPDPRQSLFLSYYFDPMSDTFSNAYKSAIKAKYNEEYAQNITHLMPTWLSEAIGDQQLIKQAEANLREFLMMETVNTGTTKKGDVFEFNDPRLVKIKQDSTKFALERLNKEKYSTRSEFTGKDGKDLVPEDQTEDIRKAVLNASMALVRQEKRKQEENKTPHNQNESLDNAGDNPTSS